MSKQTWGIVATMDEPAPLILAFVGYHLAQGADEIHLYLDAPNPEAEAVLDGLERVILTRTDAEYWSGNNFKARPPRHTARQLFNVKRAYRMTKADWLLHMDADEFVADVPKMERLMAEAGPNILFVLLGVMERVIDADAPAPETIFDGIFRTAGRDYEDWGPTVYGRFMKFLQRGLSGHAAGKAVVRTGRDLKMGIHFPEKMAKVGADTAIRTPRMLYHFDGMTKLHFFLKLVRRLYYPPIPGNRNPHGIGRGQQIRYAGNRKSDVKEMERLYSGTHTLTREQITALQEMNTIIRERFDPSTAMASVGITADLSIAAFDAALRAREAALIEKSELPL